MFQEVVKAIIGSRLFTDENMILKAMFFFCCYLFNVRNVYNIIGCGFFL